MWNQFLCHVLYGWWMLDSPRSQWFPFSMFAGASVLASAVACTKVHPGLGWGPLDCFISCPSLQLCSGGDLAELGAPALVLGLFLYPLGHEAQAEAFGGWGGGVPCWPQRTLLFPTDICHFSP